MTLDALKRAMAESYQNIISESVIYVKPNEIPEGIRNWVRQTAGASIQNYRVDQSGKPVHISQPAFERCVATYQYFELTENGGAVPIGNPVSRKGWESDSPQGYREGQGKEGEVPIQSGRVLVRYSSYPSVVDIYTGAGAQMFLKQDINLDELTDNELIILATAKSLKSFARPKFPDQYYVKLIEKGYLMRNKSISIEGRNLLTDEAVKARIRVAIDKFNTKYPGHSIYL